MTEPREGETVTTQDDTEGRTPDRFVGYRAAADYLGLQRNTLSSYVARGIGPAMDNKREADGQYNFPVFKRAELDRWRESRPGQGARTDLAEVAS